MSDYSILWPLGGEDYPWPQTAQGVCIALGGDPRDIAGGSGARTITIEGLDASWNKATETLATNGRSASAITSTQFIRINRVYVSACGTYGGSNDGNISIENTTSLDVLAYIKAGAGETQQSPYSIPSRKRAYLTNIVPSITSGKPHDVRLLKRENADVVTGAVSASQVVHEFIAIDGRDPVSYKSYIRVPEKSDIWAETTATVAGVSCTLDFDLYLTDIEGDA